MKNTNTFSGNITLTESLDSNNFIAATVSTNINQNNNDRLAYLKDVVTLGYTRLDTFSLANSSMDIPSTKWVLATDIRHTNGTLPQVWTVSWRC